MKLRNYLNEEVTDVELKAFESKWLSRLKSIGLTAFEFTSHMKGSGDGRINASRNVPPITIDELDFVMNGFVTKMGPQLTKDISDVSKNIAKKRGKNKQNIPNNCIEYTIISKNTKINFAMALRQDRKHGGAAIGDLRNKDLKGTSVLVPITILRKKKWITKQGVEVVVERTTLEGIQKTIMVD